MRRRNDPLASGALIVGIPGRRYGEDCAAAHGLKQRHQDGRMSYGNRTTLLMGRFIALLICTQCDSL
jgi:hypothetical protein